MGKKREQDRMVEEQQQEDVAMVDVDALQDRLQRLETIARSVLPEGTDIEQELNFVSGDVYRPMQPVVETPAVPASDSPVARQRPVQDAAVLRPEPTRVRPPVDEKQVTGSDAWFRHAPLDEIYAADANGELRYVRED